MEGPEAEEWTNDGMDGWKDRKQRSGRMMEWVGEGLEAEGG